MTQRGEGAPGQPVGAAGARVLVVDDDPALVRVVRKMLHVGGFDVETATSAAEILERLLRDPPDVLLLDLNLPGTSGLELLCAVSESSARDLPVLLLTGESEQDGAVRHALELGALDCLVKPVALERLLAAVRVAALVGSLRRTCAALRAELDELRATPPGTKRETSAPRGAEPGRERGRGRMS